MPTVLDHNLVCSFCQSGNCKLFRRRNDNWETAELFCYQCLIDQELVTETKPKWFGNDQFVFPGDPEKLTEFKEHFTYISIWSCLPQFPEWWKFLSNKNWQRTRKLRIKLEQETIRLSVGEVGFAFEDSKKKCFMICIDNSKTQLFSIPETIHIISWLQNLSGPISKEIFLALCEKIHLKYL